MVDEGLTPNYNFTLYGDKTPADFRNGYNDSVNKIDSELLQQSTDINTATTAATAAQTAATAAQTTADTNLEALTALTAETPDKATSLLHSISLKANQSDFDTYTTNEKNSGNVIYLGVDNTGTNNVSEKINSIIDSGNYRGLYFPAGTYNVDSQINLKNMSLIAAPGAKFVAVSEMENIINITSIGTYRDIDHNVVIEGGLWDANKLAKTCIKGDNIDNKFFVRNLIAVGATEICVDVSTCHGCVVDNVYINGLHTPVTGLKTQYDSQFSNIKIFACEKAIDTTGANQFSNIYIWGGSSQENRHTYGFYSDNSFNITASTVYIDCCQSGFYNVTAGNIRISSLFVYINPADMPASIPATLFDIPKNARIAIKAQNITGSRTCNYSRDFLSNGISVATQDIDENHFTDIQHYYNSFNNEPQYLQVTETIDLPAGKAIELFRSRAFGNDVVYIRNNYGDFNVEASVNETRGYILQHRTDSNTGIKLYASNTKDDLKTRIIYAVNDGTTTASKTRFGIKFEWATSLTGFLFVEKYLNNTIIDKPTDITEFRDITA